MGYEIMGNEALIEALYDRDIAIEGLKGSISQLESIDEYKSRELESLRKELWDTQTKLAEAEEELKNEREANAPLRAVACDLAIENQAFKKRLKRC
jgi:hypothetical protein